MSVWTQPDLFNGPDVRPRNRADVQPISRVAYESVKPTAASMRRRIVDYIGGLYGGATCDEVERALSMRHQTASARLSELRRAGTLVYSGSKRKTRSGRMANVYAVAEGKTYE